MKKKILIAGGKGYLGQILSTYFKQKGHEVYILTRSPKQETDVYWDGETYGEWIHVLNHCDVLINLAGKSVNCRYNAKNKKEIYDSRIKSTRILGHAIKISKTPPKVWINSSTATIYDHSEIRANTEKQGVIGHDFSMGIAKSWEKTVHDANIGPSTRQVLLRTSVVLGAKGEAFKTLKNLVLYGLGGTQGSGKQMVSWIHEEDFAKGVEFIINNNHLNGAVNLTAPNPVNNLGFMKTFRKILRRPFGIAHPAFLLNIGAFILGTESELILKSRYVVPEILLKARFVFKYPRVDMALENIVEGS